MKDYISIRRASANENGEEELELESEWSLWQSIWFALTYQNMPGTKIETYVKEGVRWVEKDTGIIPDNDMQIELFECRSYIMRNDKLDSYYARFDETFDQAYKEIDQYIEDTK